MKTNRPTMATRRRQLQQAGSRMNGRPGRRLQVLQRKLERLPTGEEL
jgi:hypothetical protein